MDLGFRVNRYRESGSFLARGVKRLKAGGNECKTPSLERRLRPRPQPTPSGQSRQGPCWPRFSTMVRGARTGAASGCSDLQSRKGVPHPRVLDKGAKVHYVPAHPFEPRERIHDYLQATGHSGDAGGPLLEVPEEPGRGGGNQSASHPRGHLPLRAAQTRPSRGGKFRQLWAARPARNRGHQRAGPRGRPG
jgi:hypothetical protein